MDKETFTKQLKERLEEVTGCNVNIHTTPKNNGIKLEALTIMRKGKNTYPTIYIDIWWDLYNTGESFEDIIAKVLEWERNSSVNNAIDLDFFLNFDRVKENLRFKIINTEKNIDLLNNIPHKDFLDLSKVYLVEVSVPQIGNGTVLVSNEHIKLWGLTWEELDRYATEMEQKHNLVNNFSLVDFAKRTMGELMEIEEKEDIEEIIPNFVMPPVDMYVFTTKDRVFCAAVLLYEDALRDFATEKEDDLYILPSSTHELIVIPAKVAWYPGLDHLKYMVKEVNATQVEPEEFLSDNVYFYNRQTERIKIV